MAEKLIHGPVRLHLNKLLCFLWALMCIQINCACASADTKSELLGYWKFKRGLGGPCEALIVKLEYSFLRDGRFQGKTTLTNGASHNYTGTFSATNTHCTTYVDGQTVGPHAYEIKNDILTISQPEFNCRVQLEREDY